MELEEMRLTTYESSKLYKERVKKYHDKKLLKKDFQLGQQVLLFNSDLNCSLESLNQSGLDHLP